MLNDGGVASVAMIKDRSGAQKVNQSFSSVLQSHLLGGMEEAGGLACEWLGDERDMRANFLRQIKLFCFSQLHLALCTEGCELNTPTRIKD